MSETSEKLVYKKQRLSKLQFDVGYRIDIKHQASEAISRLSADRGEKKPADEITSLPITTNTVSTDEAEKEQEAWETYKRADETRI